MKASFFQLLTFCGLIANVAWADNGTLKKKSKSEHKIVAEVFQKGNVLSEYASLDLDAPEISAYMPAAKMLFTVGGEKFIEITSFVDSQNPKLENKIPLDGHATSVSVYGDWVAVSMTADEEYKQGHVQLFRYNDGLVSAGKFQVCHLPDMLTFTPDGKNILVACEGSPSEDMNVDPEGAVAILNIQEGQSRYAPAVSVKVADFHGIDTTAALGKGVRKVGLGNFYQAMEPEYITVSENSKTAWVSLQENNGLAKVDIEGGSITEIFPLGYVDHSRPGFGLDPEEDGKIKIRNFPIRGLRQPDGICAFDVYGKSFVLTANEGAPVNDYKAWTDETSVKKLLLQKRLDESVFTEKVQVDLRDYVVSDLERCNVAGPDEVLGGLCPYVYGFGSRSISIFDGESGTLIWDSGDLLEQTLAKVAPDFFNWNSKKEKVKVDARSGKQGCEPENVTLGKVNGKSYAFVGLERSSGIAVFDVSEISQPRLVDFFMNPKDRGPEGMLFISAAQSPIPGQALLVVGYEYSKTLTVYKVN